jgi:streptogramin lyase
MKILGCITLCLLSTLALAQSSGEFDLIADYRDIGGLIATAVGPGPTLGTERVYASYIYFQNTFDILSIDPETGGHTVFQCPIPGEWAAYGVAVGRDGAVYLGTTPNAHFAKLDPIRGSFVDLGRPSKTEEWMYDLTFGSDNRLYGVTYPNAKLVRYTPATGELEDLGRLDPTEKYARYIVASEDGFLYVDIGTSRSNIAVYEIATGQHKEILPADAQSVGSSRLYRGQDGNVYGVFANRLFRISHWSATEITSKDPKRPLVPPASPALHDGRVPSLSVEGGELKLVVAGPSNQQKSEHNIDYGGEKLSLFRIGFGPDNALYGGSVLPANLVQINQAQHAVTKIGGLGAGEVYSTLSHRGRLLLGVYAGMAPLMSYQPEIQFHPAPASGNPNLISPTGIETTWRPTAMIDGPNDNVYVASVAAYGKLEAPLLEFNPETGVARRYDGVIHDQSIVSLAVWHNLIVGGTTIKGGGGSHPTQGSAILFLWNPKTTHEEVELSPVPGKGSIYDLVVAPNDRIYGIAEDTLFEFDPRTKTIVSRKALPFSDAIYNSAALGSDGKIWGLAKLGIFTVDPATLIVQLVARSPVEITGGFAMRNGKIYFSAGSLVYAYTM